MQSSKKVRTLTSVGRRFFSIGFDLHSTGNTAVSFTSGKIGDMDEGVVEGGLNVADSESKFVLTLVSLGRSVVSDLLFFDFLSFLWWLHRYKNTRLDQIISNKLISPTA